MKNYKREKKEKKRKERGDKEEEEQSLLSFGYPRDFPRHLVELCSDGAQSEIKKNVSFFEVPDDNSLHGTPDDTSKQFMDGFPKKLILNQINSQDQFGNTPLVYLAGGGWNNGQEKKRGKKKEERRGGMEVSFEDPVRQLALYFSKHNSTKLLINLVTNWNADPNILDNRGSSPLHYATNSNSSADVIETLLKVGKADPNLRNHEGIAPIHLAFGSWSSLCLLLEEGADPNLPNKRKETPLHIFFAKPIRNERTFDTWNGCTVDAALLLLRHPRCDPNAQNEDGETPLHVLFNSPRASQFAKKAAVIVRVILKRGGDPTIKDNQGRTAYQCALDRFGLYGHSLFHLDRWMKIHAPAKLLKARRSVGWPHDLVDRDGNSVLHLLMEEVLADRTPYFFPGFVRYHGCSIEEEFVPFQENLELIQDVLDAKVDVKTKNSRGETPLHIAAMFFFYEGVKILISKNGTIVNSHNNNLETPLISAVASLKKLDEEKLAEIEQLTDKIRHQNYRLARRNEVEARPVVCAQKNRRQKKRQIKRDIQKKSEVEEEERMDRVNANKEEEVQNVSKCDEEEETKSEEEVNGNEEEVEKEKRENDGGREWDEKDAREMLEQRMMCKMENGLRVIEVLLSARADPNVETREKQTSLHFACALADPAFSYQIVRLLLKAGAKPNLRDARGRTPMMIACENDSPSEEVLDLLIQAGADLGAVDNVGLDSLFRLVTSPHAPVSIIQKKLMMDFVLDPDYLPKDKSLLRQAIDCLSRERERELWENQAAIIEMLVEKGVSARTRLKTLERTALEYFVVIASRGRKRHQDWAIFGPIFLRIGLVLGAGGITQLEKRFVFERIGRDVLSPTLHHLWKQLGVSNDLKPAKR